MKKLFAALAFALAHPAVAGPVGAAEVVEVPGTTKDALFLAARAWMVEAFKDSEAVIQLEDKEAGVLMGKGNFAYSSGKGALSMLSWLDGRVDFTLKIELKDGKYRVSLSDVVHVGVPHLGHAGALSCGPLTNPPAPAMPKMGIGDQKRIEYCVPVVQLAEARTTALLASLKSSITTPTASTDW